MDKPGPGYWCNVRVNFRLTPKRYYLKMQNKAYPGNPDELQKHTGSKTGIWLALGIALILHTVMLLVPISRQAPGSGISPAQIELELTTIEKPHAPEVTAIPEPLPVPEPTPEEVKETILEPIESFAETKPADQVTPDQTLIRINRDFEKMNKEEKSHLTNTILSSQFITGESAADRLFGKPLEPQNTELQKEFHYPARQSLVTMLDKPMQDLPFQYTPGLVRFAYEPGVKGDLQRFWDVITPEFGWTTKYGTEVKCIWVLIIGGCGWK